MASNATPNLIAAQPGELWRAFACYWRFS